MEPTFSQKLFFIGAKYLSWVLPSFWAGRAENIFLTPSRVPRPSSEKAWFENSRKHTLSGGIAAFEWGPSSGPIVALVHGWSGRGTQMGAFVAPLVERGYRVIAFDGPAHGGSAGQQTNVGDYANFLIRMQQELGEFKAVIAHSFGAGCSVFAAARGLKVEKLVLVAGPSRYEVVVGNYLRFIGLSSKAKNLFLASLAKKVGMTAKDLNVGVIGEKLRLPAMVIHDREDKEVPYVSAEEIKQAWPHVVLVDTKGLGHRRILKDPAVIQKAAEFIDSTVDISPSLK
jgi:pimeloyl-ACP methyl ester carboxylesterase